MEKFMKLQEHIASRFEPEWHVSGASISEPYENRRYLSFDLVIGKGYMGIMEKVSKVYDEIIGNSFGVVEVELGEANTTLPSVRFKVFDKEEN